jgi:hypothetical protein
MQPTILGFWAFVWKCIAMAVDVTSGLFKLEPKPMIITAIALAFGFYLYWRKRGKEKTKEKFTDHLHLVIVPMGIMVLAVFAFNLLRSPYLIYRATHETATSILQQSKTYTNQLEQEKRTLGRELEQERDKSQPKFEIVTAAASIGEGDLLENGKRIYFGDTYLQVAVLNHGAPSVIKEWKGFVRLKNGTELEGRLLMGREKNIHMTANGPRGRVELPIYPSLITIWSITPIPTGGRGVGSVIFVFPRGTKVQAEGPGGAVVLKLWDISGKEYRAEVPWQAPPPNQEVYMLPGMGRN